MVGLQVVHARDYEDRREMSGAGKAGRVRAQSARKKV